MSDFVRTIFLRRVLQNLLLLCGSGSFYGFRTQRPTRLHRSSSNGLGFATAITLAREGYKVAVNSREKENAKAAAEKITNETGTQAFGMVGDVSDSMLHKT